MQQACMHHHGDLVAAHLSLQLLPSAALFDKHGACIGEASKSSPPMQMIQHIANSSRR
jgi:hypothetical protein